MADSKRFLIAALAAVCPPAMAQSIGADFVDAGLYKRLEHSARGPRTLSDWIAENVTKRLSVVGRESLGLHMARTEGDLIAYQNATAFGQGNQTFTNVGQMSVSGSKVAGLFSFNTTFADNHYQDPTSHRLSSGKGSPRASTCSTPQRPGTGSIR